MIALQNIGITAGDFRLENISFSIPTGRWCVFMGRTGSGKTTLLEIVCGLRTPASGRVFIHDVDVTGAHPSVRGIGYVPQDKALFQTMTVRDNLAFALKLRRWSPDAIHERVNELADWLHIKHLMDRYPHALSGGEAQRVALGRALAPRPTVLCMDEPLSALDDYTRDEMRAALKQVRSLTEVTTLHITHHAADAEGLADQMLILDGGKLITDRV